MKIFTLGIIFTLNCAICIGQTDTDQKAIASIVDDIATAWTAGSGEGFAEHFAEEHDYFVWNGLYFPNNTRKQNAMTHDHIFNTMYKDTKHYALLDQVRFVKPDVAVITVMAAITSKGEPKPEHPQVLWSGTLVKSDGKWEIVSFHNADIEILQSEESRKQSPMPTEVMYRKWYAAEM